MLQSLSIRDIVLIDRLELALAPGLSVLTGETGAGKSILLDSLGLALGARAESGLLRQGAEAASVAAVFELAENHPAHAVLAEQDLACEDGILMVRRTLGADGRSRAFVNDRPVGVALLKRLGETLVEIHGQFESHGLLDAATHGAALDSYGKLETSLAETAARHGDWQAAAGRRARAEAEFQEARREEEFLRHATGELETLAPKAGEETSLAEERQMRMHGEKLVESLAAAQAALSARGEVEANLRQARRALEKVADKAPGKLDPAIAALDRAADEVAEAAQQLEKVAAEIDADPRRLEKIEERLFALRACARKHGVAVDELPRLKDEFAAKLAALDSGGADIVKLARAEQAARAAYLEAARTLSRARGAAAQALDKAVAAELAPLKLDKAVFKTEIAEKPESEWNKDGLDRIAFQVSTNPGAAPGPLAKIASGGELARFMLALKVVLARVGAAPTLVFDEVDTGIGGAVAAAVGERLARLGTDFQVLVVTHSPQVAARGRTHLRVAKNEDKKLGALVTRVDRLDPAERQEEIARMLAGAKVTDEARAAAQALLDSSQPKAKRPARVE